MKRLFLIITLLCFVHYFAFADDAAILPKGKIKGAVINSSTNEPLEYATVALYSAKDNKLISGTITDYQGQFKLEWPEAGEYYLQIKFIGLSDETTEVFSIGSDHSNINLGNIFLEPASAELSEVEIVENVAPIEYKIDKKVINVDKQITAEAGTAVDVLETVPSVQVDIDGNVTLRGSSGFTVLIDGKPTILDPSDALRQIPSSSIQNIEIITNPSVKYNPDGATGIINIITKKHHIDGLSGIVNASLGMYNQYGGDFQLNYRLRKFNFMLGANYNNRTRPGSISSERETSEGDSIFYVNSNGDTEREMFSNSIKAGFEYNPSKNDFVSLAGRVGGWDMSSNSTLLYNDWSSLNPNLLSYNSYDETTRGGSYYSVDGYYQHNFTKKVKEQGGEKQKQEKTKSSSILHSLKFELNFRYRNMNEESTNQISTLTDTLLGGKKNVEKGPMNSLEAKIDYTLPIGKLDKFETGIQFRKATSNDTTELYVFNSQTGEIEFIPDFSNTTVYSRNIFAAYALYAGMVGKFGYQAGLRTEYTNRLIEMTGEDEFLLNRWDYFPTLHLSYKLPLKQQLMASYARRINRPRGWQLEPFITWQDAYNVRQGNPDLKPEYIDSYDMGYLKRFKNNFFSLEAYYRVTHNKVERVSSVYTDIVMLHTYENVGQDYSLGLEGMLSLNVIKWWSIEISGTFYNYKLEGTLYDEPFSRTSTNWNSRFNNTFTLWKTAKLQLNSRYNSETVTAQGTSSGYYSLDGAFKLTFLDRSLSVNLQARDLLSTTKREKISEGPGFNSYYISQPKSPMAVLTISYRFNNFKQNKRISGEGIGDDEL